jgi:hypothetical protein
VDARDLIHAYAVLGLNPPVTQDHLKHHYKELVIRWHPDRFQSDPAGQAEATIMLRNINLAYKVAAASIAAAQAPRDAEPEAEPDRAPGATPWNAAPPEVHAARNRAKRPVSLSPEEVDAIVESINSANRIFKWPEGFSFRPLSFERWLSLVCAAAEYFVLVGAAAPTPMSPKGDMGRGIILPLFFLILLVPLGMIWAAGACEGLDRWTWRVFAWFYLALPVLLYLLIPTLF